MELLGYQVNIFNDSREALEAFRSQPEIFDLVISDVTMPHMTGIELTREILEIRPGMPIILCSGYREFIDEKKAEILGVRHFLVKPVSWATYAKVIKKIVADT